MSDSVGELSPAGIYELGADLRALGYKTGLGWFQLAGHLRRFGSIPSDERSVASILGVTVRFMRERAWPLLEDRLVLSDDGRRYSCPDITPWSGRPRTPARAPDRDTVVKSPQQQEAANARWRRNRLREETHAQAHAQTHADASEPHAETHGISMRGASKTHAETHSGDAPNASAGASGASFASHARPDLLASSSFSQPIENRGESEEGSKSVSQDARASADASRMRSDASGHANGHADTGRPTGPGKRWKPGSGARIPKDWEPAAEDRLEAQRRGLNPDETVVAFRDHFLGLSGPDSLSPDWSARFRTWCRRELGAGARQRHATLVVPGGKPSKDAWKFERMAEILAKQRAREADGGDDGPIIQGQAM